MSATYIPKLQDVEFGEIDANVEYYKSIKTETLPTYKKAFVTPPLSYWPEFLNGDRFIVFGQKGTGKTALLRILESESASSHSHSDFLEFKDEILEESDLYDSAFTKAIDAKKLEGSRHYLHTLKRIIIVKLLALVLKSRVDSALNENSNSFINRIIKKI